MKTSILASTLALVASAMAAQVTEYRYVTVDAQGNIIGDSSSSFFPTTLLTVTRGNATLNGTSNSTTSYYSSTSVYSTVTPTILQSTVSIPDAYDVPTSSSAAPAFTPPAPTTSTTSTSSPAAQPTTKAAPQQKDTSSSDSSSDSGSSSGSSGSSGAGSSFAQAILAAHNQKRASHNASPLSWSSSLESYAQNYANKFQCGGSLVHSGGPYGENLALGYSDGPAAVDAWYSEGANYDYSSCSVFDHFTQVIWKSTTQVGCAYKDCGGLYIICSYNPAGNFIGQGPQNLSQ